MTCDQANTIPRNIPSAGITGFPDNVGPNQLCSLVGSGVGQNSVDGNDYMYAGYRYTYSHVWRNFGILIGFWCFFMFLQMVFIEYLNHGGSALSVVVYHKPNKVLNKRNERLAERREAFNKGELEQDLSSLTMAPQPFTWENLNYHVPVKGGQRQLLTDVYGYVKPGSLTALMGASGAGKTTLLDVLASRKTTGVIKGDILMNGRPTGIEFQRGCAYGT